MSFKTHVVERIPKRDDDESHPFKNCPFCGSNQIQMQEASIELNTRARVWCGNCGCGTPFVLYNTIAVGLWQKRVE